MRNTSISDLITKSIDRTKFILFDPISIKKWIYLLFIAYMAGAIGGGSGGNNFGGREKNAEASIKQEFALAQNNNSYNKQIIKPVQESNPLIKASEPLTNQNNYSKKGNFSDLFSNIS
ncbi:MAG: hypothetical protein KKF78_10720, partial [Candidatus Omnitrophica bacterium]|nr:hypothetical protein [Candidatus Omnitrophota bacterium]